MRTRLCVLLLLPLVCEATSLCSNSSAIVSGDGISTLNLTLDVPATFAGEYSVCLGDRATTTQTTLDVQCLIGPANISRPRATSDACFRGAISTVAPCTAVLLARVQSSAPSGATIHATACASGQVGHLTANLFETTDDTTFIATVCSASHGHLELGHAADACTPADGTRRTWLVAVVDDAWSANDNACAQVAVRLPSASWSEPGWARCLAAQNCYLRAMSETGRDTRSTRTEHRQPSTSTTTTGETVMVAFLCAIPLIRLLVGLAAHRVSKVRA